MVPELLLYTGIGICAATVFGAVVAAIVLHITKKRLNQRLNEEYGKRRH